MASSTGCDKGLNLIIFVSLIITSLFSKANATYEMCIDLILILLVPTINNGMFPGPEAEFDLLIGDWSYNSYKWSRSSVQQQQPPMGFQGLPDIILMNGKDPHGHQMTKLHETFTVTQGKTYRFRISNVGSTVSFNFRIQNHQMVLVETEGSYSNQITLDSLDVHVGQS
ncbi:hypothetical protein F8388_022679 [Cannabis sativa]|uniref:Plastocyanin-like domain-containing protein n=1 Tax=Cannabis sativa TaxID=3483 RepID=A0A7J6G1T9_CANSA|nr:hypothetical protein F8388_022679 [Cannabis sativa]